MRIFTTAALLIATAMLLASTLPASASWKVSQSSAIIENDGNSALSLVCDNNANTNFKPGWLVRIDALDLNRVGPRVRVDFRFAGYRIFSMMADNRQGHISIDSMNQATQSDILTLVSRLKAASRVTVTVIDDANGHAMEPLAFGLTGSSRAISQIAQACR